MRGLVMLPRWLCGLVMALGVVVALAVAGSASATASPYDLDFELNQSDVMGANGYPQRTDGDVRLSYGGWGPGVSPMVTEYHWVNAGPCAAAAVAPPCWGPGAQVGYNDSFHGMSSDEAERYWYGDDREREGSFGYWVSHPYEHHIYPKNRCVHHRSSHMEHHWSMEDDSYSTARMSLSATSMPPAAGGTYGSLEPYHPPKPENLGNCDLAIAKTGPAQVGLGAAVLYTVTVTNVGDLPVPRDAIHVTDPEVTNRDLVFFKEVAGDGDTLLEPGEAWEYRLYGGAPVSLPAAACGDMSNTATVTPLPKEKQTGNNSGTATTTVGGPACAPPLPPVEPPPGGGATGGPTPLPDTTLKIAKLGRLGARANAPLPYRIRVTNVGPVTAKNVVVSDRIPAGMSLVRRPKGSVLRHGVLSWTIASLAPGRFVQIGLWLRSDTNRARRVCNSARVAGDNAPSAKASRCTRLITVAGVARTPVTG